MKLRNKIIFGLLGTGVIVASTVATAVVTASCGSKSPSKPAVNVPKVTLNQPAIISLIKRSTGVDDFATLTVGQMVNKINDQANNKAIVDALKQNANKEINNASDKLSESNLVVIASSSNNDVSVQIQGIPQTDNNLVNLSLTLTGFKAWKQTSLNKDEFVNIVKEKTSVTDFTMVTSMQMLTKINDAKATIISALTSNENGVIVNPTESLSSATIELTATDLSDSIDITISGVPALSEDGTDTTIQLDAVLNGFKKWTNTSLNQEAVTNLIKQKTGISDFSTVTANQMINKINSVKEGILTDLKANANGEIVNPGKELASSTLTLDATSNEQTVNIVIGGISTDLEDGTASTVNLKLSLNGFKPWVATSLDNAKMIQTIQTATTISNFSTITAGEFKNKMVESNQAIIDAIKANTNGAIVNPGATLSEATGITITPTVSNQTIKVTIAGIPTLLENGTDGTCELSLTLEGFKAWVATSLDNTKMINLIKQVTNQNDFSKVTAASMNSTILSKKDEIITELKKNANNEIVNPGPNLDAAKITLESVANNDTITVSISGIPTISIDGSETTAPTLSFTMDGFKSWVAPTLDESKFIQLITDTTKVTNFSEVTPSQLSNDITTNKQSLIEAIKNNTNGVIQNPSPTLATSKDIDITTTLSARTLTISIINVPVVDAEGKDTTTTFNVTINNLKENSGPIDATTLYTDINQITKNQSVKELEASKQDFINAIKSMNSSLSSVNDVTFTQTGNNMQVSFAVDASSTIELTNNSANVVYDQTTHTFTISNLECLIKVDLVAFWNQLNDFTSKNVTYSTWSNYRDTIQKMVENFIGNENLNGTNNLGLSSNVSCLGFTINLQPKPNVRFIYPLPGQEESYHSKIRMTGDDKNSLYVWNLNMKSE